MKNKFILFVSGTLFMISCTKTPKPFVCGDNITDIDGNVYATVSIGGQCWMKENLKTSKYNDGTAIPTGLDNTTWNTTTSGAYAIYDNNAVNSTTYGKLYNKYAVNTGILAPAGWHVPTDAEWSTLTTYLGGESVAGDKMKTTILWNPSSGITNTNSSGFSGLPAGTRNQFGTFDGIGNYGIFWSSTDYSTNAWIRALNFSSSNAYRSLRLKQDGISVRCIRD